MGRALQGADATARRGDVKSKRREMDILDWQNWRQKPLAKGFHPKAKSGGGKKEEDHI